MTITAAADGSALGNPGPAGWAWYVDEDHWAAGGWPHGTNNQGELMAVLDLFTATADDADQELHVLCDSQYVINTVTKWMPGWKRKGWRKADGSAVLNLELIKELDAAIAGRRFRFEWVKGHAGHTLNEAADERARAAALAYQNGSALDSGPGWSRKAARALDDTDTLFGIDVAAAALSDAATVERLERRLLDPLVRADAAEVARLLHPQFEEIGASGRHYDRDTVLQILESDPRTSATVEDVTTDAIADGVILLTYRSETNAGARLRSSLWVRQGSHWRLRFHQGTPERS
ncbi:ribonuclease HI family protein [Rathayibacter soli]|uniref:ribonuclease HI family protein n=1 Tax=Rathayibacter soli TaxID=3144168 RepID=UPI0027E4AAD6|nr:ribonuclease HI family protein [Glaciibacter superstes]